MSARKEFINMHLFSPWQHLKQALCCSSGLTKTFIDLHLFSPWQHLKQALCCSSGLPKTFINMHLFSPWPSTVGAYPRVCPPNIPQPPHIYPIPPHPLRCIPSSNVLHPALQHAASRPPARCIAPSSTLHPQELHVISSPFAFFCGKNCWFLQKSSIFAAKIAECCMADCSNP